MCKYRHKVSHIGVWCVRVYIHGRHNELTLHTYTVVYLYTCVYKLCIYRWYPRYRYPTFCLFYLRSPCHKFKTWSSEGAFDEQQRKAFQMMELMV